MKILTISNLEKHDGNAIIFPAFQLNAGVGETIAIHANMNVQKVLMEMLLGEQPISAGELKVNNISISESRKLYLQHTAVFSLQDGLYERLTVKEHFSFYQKLNDSNLTAEEILNAVQLEERKNTRIGKLTFSEKRRVHFGNMLFKDASLYVFEEPDQNVDLETKRVFIRIVQMLISKDKAVIILTGNLESALAVTDRVYRLAETGLHKLDITAEESDHEEAEGTEVVVAPVRFEKIPTKVNDKIILFDPPEIDYIESSDGQSQIYIKGEIYQSMFTLNELEERLQPFGFFRCHRSYIVNLQKVREVVTWTRNSFTLVLNDANKSSVPLSKSKMAELKVMLGLK